MKIIRRESVPVSIVMTVLVLLPSVPCPPVQAALIDTETAQNSLHPQNDRQLVKAFLARTDVQNALIAQGIDPFEAQMRVDSLTNEEISAIKDNIVNLPAGGEVLGLAILVLVIVLLVVVIMRLK
ncbi:MAG: PA2779 family protein [Hyphomicrobiales bacterium]